MLKAIYSSLVLSLLWTSANAGSVVFAVGVEALDRGDSQSGTFAIEYKTLPFYRFGSLTTGFTTASRAEEDGDFFLGGGIVGEWRMTSSWFVELSVLPGYYESGENGTELGGNFQFRSLLGFGYTMRNNSSISLAVDHLSNSSIDEVNPGTESIAIRFEQRF